MNESPARATQSGQAAPPGSPRAAFPPSWAKMNVVLAHDWLTGMRGGERVLELLCRGFPRAPLFTLIHNPKAMAEGINAHAITTSWLQQVPGIMAYYRYFLPFFPAAVERMQVPEAELLISSSHCVAKGFRPRPGMKHLCYCFTPMRYAWRFYKEYFGGGRVKRLLLEPMLGTLRRWDFHASSRVDRFVAISHHVQRRITSYYGRESHVVYPPVNTEFFTPGPAAGHDGFDLIVSALVPYKRVDLAVQAYTRLGYPLKVIGVGTDLAPLRHLAGPNVEFLGWQPDDRLRDWYRRCRCLVFPGEEDFGIVPVEAQACGKPVVAYALGGILETVVENSTGVFFAEQTVDALLHAVEDCAARKWDPVEIQRNAARFSVEHFLAGLDTNIRQCLLGKP